MGALKLERRSTQRLTAEEKRRTGNSVNHPRHYNEGQFEAIDVIRRLESGFNTGNCVKYVARAKYKGKELEDLKKAAWYLAREIQRLEKTK